MTFKNSRRYKNLNYNVIIRNELHRFVNLQQLLIQWFYKHNGIF